MKQPTSLELFLLRALTSIAIKAEPVRKKSRRANDIYLEALVALQIAKFMETGSSNTTIHLPADRDILPCLKAGASQATGANCPAVCA
jgi:hypothetical protein